MGKVIPMITNENYREIMTEGIFAYGVSVQLGDKNPLKIWKKKRMKELKLIFSNVEFEEDSGEGKDDELS